MNLNNNSNTFSMKTFFQFFVFLFSVGAWGQQWTLKQALDYALAHHPAVEQSLLEVRGADHRIAMAKGNLLPGVNVSLNRNYSFGSTIDPNSNSRKSLNTQSDQLNVTVPMVLFDWRNYLNIGLSRWDKESSEYRLRSVQNEIVLNVIQAFFQYQSDKAWLEVISTQIGGVEEQIARIEQEVAIGTRPKSDVYDIKANLGTLREQWISARNQKELAKNNLLYSIGLQDEAVDFVLEDELPESELLDRDDFVTDLLERNPLYRQALKQYQISEKKVALAKADFLPRLSAVYQWSTFYSKVLGASVSGPFSLQFKTNQNDWVALGLEIPVFNRFQTKHRVGLAKLSLQNAALEKDKVVLELTKNLKAIGIQFIHAREKYAVSEANFENQKQSFQKSEEKYKEGLLDAYTFFMVRNAWLNANFNRIKSRYDLMLQSELLKIYTE